MSELENNAEAPAPPSAEASFEETQRQRMRRHFRRVMDHVWGPTGSIILHILLVILLLRLVMTPDKEKQTEIEVMVMEPDAKDLEEFKKELEQLQQPEVMDQIVPPETLINVEQPPDIAPPQAQPDVDVTALDIKADVQSPLIMKGLFSGRSAAGRAASLKTYAGRFGGATESAVIKALEWLKERQFSDGSWELVDAERSKGARTAATGLALLTFLAHGETTTSERYGPTVEKAIRWLIERDLDRATGKFKGSRDSYSHGIATYALGEAYALTRIPTIKPALEAALRTIVAGQQETGGFNYNFEKATGRRDTSVAGWMIQAMKAGYVAGAEVPGLKEAMDKAIAGLRLNQDSKTGRFMYAPTIAEPKGGGSRGMTPIGVLCMQLLGYGKDPMVEAGLLSMAEEGCTWIAGAVQGATFPSGHPLYTWYYMTQAKFQRGGKTWEDWNNKFARVYVQAQNTDGSWRPGHVTEKEYGPLYGTTFSALSLMVYYRFLPTYQQVEATEIDTKGAGAADDVKIEVM